MLQPEGIPFDDSYERTEKDVGEWKGERASSCTVASVAIEIVEMNHI